MWIKLYSLCYTICGISWIACAAKGAILDSRCYLEGGGSAESFLATEDLAVGSIIGKLRINGDPNADTGDISLSLREKNAPVEIVAGTKDLALSVELDKEGLKGPSSIYVNVICIRRRSTDPLLKSSFLNAFDPLNLHVFNWFTLNIPTYGYFSCVYQEDGDIPL